MVVVLKMDRSAVRIWIDFKPSHQNVLREIHPLPMVDETLVQLSGVAVFRKLNTIVVSCKLL